MRLGIALVLVVGCGSSAKKTNDPKAAERAAAEARDREIEAMKPASPYEFRDRVVYQPSDRCGQGPYRFETDALQAKYGEKIIVKACGKHEISGNYRMTTVRKGRKDDTDESAFGFDRDNQACKARDVAVTSGSGGGGGSGIGGKGATPSGATSAAPTSIKPIELQRVTSVPDNCITTSVINMTWYAREDSVPLDGHIMIDVWSDEPNDLEGLVFYIERHAVVADMTLERWHAYQAATDAYDKAYRANLEIDVKSGRTTLLDMKVKTPPPPPPRAETQPPRPSRNARWIPGYWLYADASFHWIAGLWDVPQADLEQQLTVQAPTPPPAAPPVREEPVAPKPTTTAVWTPGNWQWDGHAYVWIEGAWRIPPDAQHTWQRPTWNVNAGKAIYVPGGWRVRVRIGH
ncbi:MAG TPA: YXWGXW repeat-containing protein [Kofleriaceae bacterium]